jgi:hypothetical protein
MTGNDEKHPRGKLWHELLEASHTRNELDDRIDRIFQEGSQLDRLARWKRLSEWREGGDPLDDVDPEDLAALDNPAIQAALRDQTVLDRLREHEERGERLRHTRRTRRAGRRKQRTAR